MREVEYKVNFTEHLRQGIVNCRPIVGCPHYYPCKLSVKFLWIIYEVIDVPRFVT